MDASGAAMACVHEAPGSADSRVRGDGSSGDAASSRSDDGGAAGFLSARTAFEHGAEAHSRARQRRKAAQSQQPRMPPEAVNSSRTGSRAPRARAAMAATRYTCSSGGVATQDKETSKCMRVVVRTTMCSGAHESEAAARHCE
ncbi:hypothetical protein Dimus_010734 [Dionaea muscipula]